MLKLKLPKGKIFPRNIIKIFWRYKAYLQWKSSEKSFWKSFEDLYDISVLMRNLLIFFGRSHEDFVKEKLMKKTNELETNISSSRFRWEIVEDLKKIFIVKDLSSFSSLFFSS